MARKRYWAYALTGGTAGAMDAIDGASLSVGDICEVINATTVDKFYLDESGDTESSPRCIAPDSNAGDKRWKLIGVTPLSDSIKYEIPVDGVTDAVSAFDTMITALSNNDVVELDSGSYLLDSDVDFGAKHVILKYPGSAVFSGDGAIVGTKYDTPDYDDGYVIHGRIIMRGETDNEYSKTGFTDTDLAAVGQSLRIDNKSVAGTCMVYLSNNENPPVIVDPIYTATTGIYCTMHSHTTQTAGVAKIWAYNPVVVKSVAVADASTGYSSVAGIEVSVSNNTAEASAPLVNGHVSGFWASYIHTSGNGSAAFVSGGLNAGDGIGWKYGLWIDGLDTAAGVGITLDDDVSANAGMNIGIDTSRVASFVTAAVKLGNNHPIGWNGSGGTFRSCLNMTTGNVLEVGNTNATLKLKSSGAALYLTGVATSTSATAGLNTLPANPAGFLNFSTDDGSTTYKIPFYNS